jgi:NCS2 family nucleobase:cation symporter-2
VLLGLLAGTALAMALGMTDFGTVAQVPWFAVLPLLNFGAPRFAMMPGLLMSLAMVVIMAETTGNCLAIGRMVGKPATPALLANAFRADGLSTAFAGFFGSFPFNAFTQNTGLIALSGVKSRYVVASAGAIMVLMGLFPKFGAAVAAIPRPVLGGSALVMFGMTTAAGIQELARVRFEGTRNPIIVAVTLSVGLLPMATPDLFAAASGALKLVLQSGILLGCISAVVLNAVYNGPQMPEDAGATTAALTALAQIDRSPAE